MARKTLIYIEEIEGELYPSENIYPADNMYPNLGTLIIGEVTGVNYTGIVSGSLSLNELLMDNELTIGKCCSNKFEVELYNVRSDLSKHKISVIQRIDDRQIDVFTGIIDSSEKNDDGMTRKITAYDIYYFKKDLDVASWWNPLFDNQAKHTIKELREGLLTYLGIPFSKVNLPNDNVQFDNTTLFNSITADTLLTLLCEFSGVTPNINRSGVMEFLYLGTTQKDLTDLYEKNTSTFEDYTTADITGIQLYGDSNSVAQIVGTEDNSFAISSNALMLTKSASELDTILNNIFDTLKSIKYVPSEVHMIESDWDIHLGDKVSTEHGIHYVMELDFSGSIFIEQTIKAVAKGETLENSPSNSRDLMAFDGKISKVEKNIDGLTVEFSDAIKATNAKIDVTAEQIKTEVGKNYTTKTETSEVQQSLKSSINETAEQIKTEVSETYSTKDETQEIKKDLGSSIEQSASSVLATVEKTYSTKDETQNLETALKLYADSASLSAAGTVSNKVDNVQKTLQASIDVKVNTKDLISEINASADVITLKGNRISITSSNASWDKDGNVKFNKGVIGQWTIYDGLYSKTMDNNGYVRQAWMRGPNVADNNCDNTWIYSVQKGDSVGESPSSLTGLWVVYGNGNMKAQDIYCKNVTCEELQCGSDGNAKLVSFYANNPNSEDIPATNVCIYNAEDVHYRYTMTEFSLWGSMIAKFAITAEGGFIGTMASDSDRNVKKDINSLDIDQSANFVYSLNPCEFRMIEGTSNRLHHGFIAQEVKETMGDADWGLFIDKQINSPDYQTIIVDDNGKIEKKLTARYALRYDELIADLVATAQSQNKRILELEKLIKER